MNKKVWIYIISCFFLLFVFGCKEKQEKNREYLSLHELLRLPQDSLTDQQKDLKQKLADMSVSYILVKDNKLKLNLSKSEFEKIGLPVVYYDQIIDDLNRTNKGVEKMKIQNLDSIYKESIDNYLKNRDHWFR